MQAGSPQFDERLINCRLSFRPLFNALKENLAQGNPGEQKLYVRVLAEFETQPQLLEPISDLSLLTPHSDLIGELLSVIFPPIASVHENIYAVSLPFKFQTIYTSKLFHDLFLKPGTNEINVPDGQISEQLNREKIFYAYAMILKKYCGYNSPDTIRSVYPFVDPDTGLTKFLELEIDARFVDIKPAGEMPKLPASILSRHTNRIMTIEELIEEVPLEKFIFEGIAIVRVNDVTGQEVISQIKNSLLNINAFSDATVYNELEKHIQSLVGLKDVRIGITPFFKVNGHYIYSDLHNSNSHLFKHFHTIADKDDICDTCKVLFRESERPFLYESLNAETLDEVEYLQYYY
ncbi:MAG TPA: hypothetical protein VET23_03920, partial [Chitinophagaceae bacterium]|nr:hypothetical protein [Chitinophagaceae bacterium]